MDSEQIFNKVVSHWKKILTSKLEWFQSYFFEGKAFVAGGAVVRLFGLQDQELWQEITDKADSEVIELAEIPFSLTGLSLLGDFYRWLKQEKQIEDHCIDERLNELLQGDSGVHQHCGASAALGGFINKAGVTIENEVLEKLGFASKQPLIPGTESEHQSLVIHIDFDKAGVFIKPEKKVEALSIGALPFNVSLPLVLINEFFSSSKLGQGQQELFIKTIYYWNVVLAKKIIFGEHNKFFETAKEFGIVVVISKNHISPDQEELLGQFLKILNSEENFHIIES